MLNHHACTVEPDPPALTAARLTVSADVDGTNAIANVPSLASAACTPVSRSGSPYPLESRLPGRCGTSFHHGRSGLKSSGTCDM